MKNNLSMLRDGIEQLDNDVKQSLFFYNNPTARAKLVQDLLGFTVTHLDGVSDPFRNEERVKEILRWLDYNYQGYEWPVHEVHFHTNFYQFATCTFTCLNEISSLLEKLIKEKFAA